MGQWVKLYICSGNRITSHWKLCPPIKTSLPKTLHLDTTYSFRWASMRFCPSDSIYLKANALLGTGLTVIQSQPSWCLYHVYWTKTRLKLVSTENNIKNQFEQCLNKGTLWQKDVNICGWGWLKGLSDMCQSSSDAFGDIILLKSEKWWAT